MFTVRKEMQIRAVTTGKALVESDERVPSWAGFASMDIREGRQDRRTAKLNEEPGAPALGVMTDCLYDVMLDAAFLGSLVFAFA